MRRLPDPRSCFFEQAVFERQVGHAFLQSAGLAAQILHLAGCRGTGSIACQATFDGFHELLRPGVLQALRDAFLTAEFRDSVLAAQTVEHDADLVLSREIASGTVPDVLYDLLFRGLESSSGALKGNFFKECWGCIFVPSPLRRSPNTP
jgi:hypothetical protein